MIKIARRVEELEASQTIQLDTQAKALVAAGQPVINLTAGELDMETPEVVLLAAEQAIRNKHNHYTAPEGMLSVRQAAQHYLSIHSDLEYTPDEIIITNGAKQALYSAIQTLVNPDDEVLIPMPGWVSYIQQVRLAGGIPVAVETDDQFRLTQQALDMAVTEATAGIIINSPNNPTGVVLSPEQLHMIAAFSQKHHLWVISDEIYDRLLYDDVSCHSIAKFYKEYTVVVNGVSKSGAMTGWRVGCAAGPVEVIAAMKKLQSHLAGNVCAIAQLAGEAAFGLDDTVLQPTLQELVRRRQLVIDWVAQHAQLDLIVPQGAFYCFINVSQVTGDSEKFCAELLAQQHVALVPGKYFGRDGFVRLSFANSFDVLSEALERIDLFMNTYIAKDASI